jgi:hypothetical protein
MVKPLLAAFAMVMLAVPGAAVAYTPIVTGVQSHTFSAPVVAVASDGPYIAAAEGKSGTDCDRVSLWWINTKHQTRVVRLGRATKCEAGSKITALSVARTRALWLHRTGGARPTWSAWTATTTRRTPRLLARATGTTGIPPIVIGPGNYDRRQGYGDGDVLPYAVGRNVVVLRADGATQYRWTAPSRVTALGSNPGLLLVAVADGRIFVLTIGETDGNKVVDVYPGTVPASRVFDGVAQRGSSLDLLHRDIGCTTRPTFGPGDRLLSAGVWLAIARDRRIDVTAKCGGKPITSVEGTAAAIDYQRFTYAHDRQVTTEFIS